MVHYPWELVQRNTEHIEKDCTVLADLGRIEGRVYEGAHLLDRSNIYIAPEAKVKPGVVLDAEGGPIFIDRGAKIFPNATIEGPAYIGKKSQIKIGAKIYEGTTIGEVCKVGGEVEGSIIHSYSNKQHDGFLGHAYLGMWVNLGADTNNSDLKNNYGNVRVTIDGEEIDTGSMFVGLTMGDHSKAGINTMFNTGTVVGAVCNVFGAGFPPKEIPSFTWGGGEGLTVYDPKRAIEVCRRVMARRDIPLTEVNAQLLQRLFELTAKDRERVGVR
jgi:UDP-N-acetylglucosamine diphosphorylase/glucosamine-1-phosphate N-acetyltransferase